MTKNMTVYIEVDGKVFKQCGINESGMNDTLTKTMCHLCHFKVPNCPADIYGGQTHCNNGHNHFYWLTDELVCSKQTKPIVESSKRHFSYCVIEDGKMVNHKLCDDFDLSNNNKRQMFEKYLNVSFFEKKVQCEECNFIMQSYPTLQEKLRQGKFIQIILHKNPDFEQIKKILNCIHERAWYNEESSNLIINEHNHGEIRLYVTGNLIYEGEQQFIQSGYDANSFEKMVVADKQIKFAIPASKGLGYEIGTFKIPEWCHVGAFVFFQDKNRFGSILRISENELSVVIKGMSMFPQDNHKEYTEKISNIKPAIFRRWTDEEINSLIPFAVNRIGTKETSTVIHTSEGIKGRIHVVGGNSDGFFSYEQFLKKFCLPNGLQCGVYEIGSPDFDDAEESKS